jgi:hypothetical protein
MLSTLDITKEPLRTCEQPDISRDGVRRDERRRRGREGWIIKISKFNYRNSAQPCDGSLSSVACWYCLIPFSKIFVTHSKDKGVLSPRQ